MIIITIIAIIWFVLFLLITAREPWAGFGFFVWTVVLPTLLILKPVFKS